MTALIIIIALIVFLFSFILIFFLINMIPSFYKVMVFLGIEKSLPKLASNSFYISSVLILASILRGAMAAWSIYLVYLVFTDYKVAVLPYVNYLVLFSLAFIFPVPLLFRASKVIKTKTHSEKDIQSDKIVLYLRGFASDGVFDDENEMWLGITASTAEERLADLFKRSGIDYFITLAKPDIKFQELGATRIEIENRDWKEVVENWLGKARIVVLRLGYSKSLLWEVDAVIRFGKLNQTLFVLPLLNSESNDDRVQYEFLKNALSEETKLTAIPSSIIDNNQFFYYDQEKQSLEPMPNVSRMFGLKKQLKPFLTQNKIFVGRGEFLKINSFFTGLIILGLFIYFLACYILPKFLTH